VTIRSGAAERALELALDGVTVEGVLSVPPAAHGVVCFAHGSGSSRHSPRNQRVAAALRDHGLATLLFDLLTAAEEREDERTAELRFDIDRLARRLVAVTDRLAEITPVGELPLGYFGASTGAAAALVAAAERPSVRAVVSRGGRPDLAGSALRRVRAPTLLIVGERDTRVLALNREAMSELAGPAELAVVARATHLFEERGALEEVARLAGSHFDAYL